MTSFATKSLGQGVQSRIANTRNTFKLFAKSGSGTFRAHCFHQEHATLSKQNSASHMAGHSSWYTTREFSTSKVPDTVSSIIEDNKVVIFSKTYCPFCSATKTLFERMGIEAEVVELDKMEDGHEMQVALQELSGQRTVPNVFINGKHLGGNDDTQAAVRSGKLEEMMK